MRHPHLAVVRGVDDEGVLQQPLLLQGVQDLHQVVVRGLDQVAVEVEVVLLLLRTLWPQRRRELLQLALRVRLRGEVLVHRRRQLDAGARQPRVVVAEGGKAGRVGEDVVRVDERDGEEEGLLLGRLRTQVGEDALLPGVGVAVVVHEPAVVVGHAAAGLADELVGAGVLRVPALEAELIYVLRLPVVADRLA